MDKEETRRFFFLAESLSDFGLNTFICANTNRATARVKNIGATFTSKRKEYGFDENDDYILFNNDFNLESGEIGYTLTKKLMTAHPEITALFVMNDTAAFGAMRALKDLGLNCPADVSVIGCDDIILSREYIPSLTSISFDKEEYGTEIGKRIIDCIRNGADYSSDVYVVKAKAIIRESVAKRR